jgi:hypothetical protein
MWCSHNQFRMVADLISVFKKILTLKSTGKDQTKVIQYITPQCPDGRFGIVYDFCSVSGAGTAMSRTISFAGAGAASKFLTIAL